MERVWMGKPGIPTQSFLGELSWSGRAYVESSDVLHRLHVNKREQDIHRRVIGSAVSLPPAKPGSQRLGGVTALSENGESVSSLGKVPFFYKPFLWIKLGDI